MERRWFRTVALVSCAIAAGWATLYAQTHFASVTGTVTSSDGVADFLEVLDGLDDDVPHDEPAKRHDEERRGQRFGNQ